MRFEDQKNRLFTCPIMYRVRETNRIAIVWVKPHQAQEALGFLKSQDHQILGWG